MRTREKPMARPEVDEVSAYCVEQGLPASDGVTVFDKWTGSGWKNGGQPIKDWKATIRAWKGQGYMPSQQRAKSPAPYGRPPISGVSGQTRRPPSCL